MYSEKSPCGKSAVFCPLKDDYAVCVTSSLDACDFYNKWITDLERDYFKQMNTLYEKKRAEFDAARLDFEVEDGEME